MYNHFLGRSFKVRLIFVCAGSYCSTAKILFHNWLVIRFFTRSWSIVIIAHVYSVSCGSTIMYFGFSPIPNISRKLLGVSLSSIFVLTLIIYPSTGSHNVSLFCRESCRLSNVCHSVLKFFGSLFLSTTLIVISLIVIYPYASLLFLIWFNDLIYRCCGLIRVDGCSLS